MVWWILTEVPSLGFLQQDEQSPVWCLFVQTHQETVKQKTLATPSHHALSSDAHYHHFCDLLEHTPWWQMQHSALHAAIGDEPWTRDVSKFQQWWWSWALHCLLDSTMVITLLQNNNHHLLHPRYHTPVLWLRILKGHSTASLLCPRNMQCISPLLTGARQLACCAGLWWWVLTCRCLIPLQLSSANNQHHQAAWLTFLSHTSKRCGMMIRARQEIPLSCKSVTLLS
jgi:hypothetical protein